MANPTVNAMASEGLQFFDTLQAQQQLAFGQNQDALNAIRKAWTPVLSSGAVPFGYSPALDSMLQAHVMSTGSQAEINAMNATLLRQQQESGGADVLPTGANAAIQAQIEATGQQAIAKGLQEEKIAGYEQGLKNLMGGTEAEMGIARETDPTKFAGATTGAGNLALSAGAEQFKENQEGSMFSKVMKGISTVAGAAKDIGLGFAGGVPALAASAGPSAAAQTAAWDAGQVDS